MHNLKKLSTRLFAILAIMATAMILIILLFSILLEQVSHDDLLKHFLLPASVLYWGLLLAALLSTWFACHKPRLHLAKAIRHTLLSIILPFGVMAIVIGIPIIVGNIWLTVLRYIVFIIAMVWILCRYRKTKTNGR